MQMKTTFRFHVTLVSMAVIKKTTANAVSSCWECKLLSLPGKSEGSFLENWKQFYSKLCHPWELKQKTSSQHITETLASLCLAEK